MAERCIFDEAWVGRCKNIPIAGNRCPKHELKCSGCGGEAIQSCDHTGQFVCGSPLCSDCRHSPPSRESKNYFGMGGGHKPSVQANAEWLSYYDCATEGGER